MKKLKNKQVQIKKLSIGLLLILFSMFSVTQGIAVEGKDELDDSLSIVEAILTAFFDVFINWNNPNSILSILFSYFPIVGSRALPMLIFVYLVVGSGTLFLLWRYM